MSRVESFSTLSRGRLQKQLQRSDAHDRRQQQRRARRAQWWLRQAVAPCATVAQLQAALHGIRVWLAGAGGG
jgi:hypothetical protein